MVSRFVRERNIAMNELRKRIDEELSDLTFESVKCRRSVLQTTERNKKMTFNKKAIAISAAAVVAVCGAVTAGAVNSWDYGRLIRGFFPAATVSESAQTFSSAVRSIDAKNVTSTFENYSVEFDGALFDGTVLMASATVAGRDGAAFTDGNYDFARIQFPEGAKGGTGGCELNGDGTLRMYCTMFYDNADVQTVAYTFEGICRYPDDPDRCELLDSGSMSVQFGLDASCETRTLTLTDRDGNAIEATLSPISLKLTPSAALNAQYDYDSVTLLGRNGALLAAEDIMYAGSETDSQTGHESRILCFTKPVDINAVTAITGEAYKAE